jgi:hypothetical protein
MNTKRIFIIKALAVATLVAISLPASAERNERHGGDGRHDGFRGGGDIRHFGRHDYGVWRSGGWRHVRHGGRLGWWWVVAGAWYFYPEPVYPYPDPYTPPVVVVQTPPANTQPAAPPPAQYWYFCAASNGYYPYVSSCPDGWKTVPATPPTTLPSVPSGAPTQ